MAFPTVHDADTKFGTVTSNSTSWTLTYPTNLQSGDLILACGAIDGPEFWSVMPSGFATIVGQGATACFLQVQGKISAGTESGNFTATVSGSEQGAWRIFRISGWYGSGLGLDADGTSAATASHTAGTNNTPDPPNLDPANWAIEDTLWFAMCSIDTSRTISVWPLAGRNTADVSGGSNGATLGICATESAVGSLNPSTFTCSANDQWVAATVAIRPAAVVARTIFAHPTNFQDPGLF